MATPTKVNLSEIANYFSGIDLFICSASYEERCLSIPLSLSLQNIRHAFVCANDDFVGYLHGNLEKLLKHFGGKSRRIHLLQSNPVFGLDNLKEALSLVRGSKPLNIVIDATTFTHEGLLILVRILAATFDSSGKITVVYTPASEYAIGLSGKDKWLSRGLREIRSVLGFPGAMMPTRRMHLVVLVGFEAERARLLIDACEPDVISLGRGCDSTDATQSHLSINVDTLRELAVHYPAFSEFNFSCVDFEATKVALQRQVEKYRGFNTIIAPMNTKLSTVGAAIFALSDPAIQLCYAPALTYNFPSYSAASDVCLVSELQIPLSSRR